MERIVSGGSLWSSGENRNVSPIQGAWRDAEVALDGNALPEIAIAVVAGVEPDTAHLWCCTSCAARHVEVPVTHAPAPCVHVAVRLDLYLRPMDQCSITCCGHIAIAPIEMARSPLGDTAPFPKGEPFNMSECQHPPVSHAPTETR